MNFKAWLYDEISLGSDGTRDNEPSQTAQATNRATQLIQKNPEFASHQSDWMGMAGNPSALNKSFLGDVGNIFNKHVPSHIGKQTNVGNVAFNLGQTSPIKGLNIPKPKFFMKKMKKRMKK